MTFHGKPPTHLTLEPLRAAGIRHAFTTRHHGGAVGPGNVSPALRQLGLESGQVRFARQVHGTRCLIADGRPPGAIGEGDALASASAAVPLAVFTADCLAVVVADPDHQVLGVAHAGWRGTVAGILGGLIATLVKRFRLRPAHAVAAIGPSIGPCCYEVDEPVVAPLQAAFSADWQGWTRPGAPGRWMLDLWQANADQLVAAGLRAERIFNPRLCTGCRRDLFFSYRKEGARGSLIAVAQLGG